MTKTKQKKKKSNENQMAITIFFIAIVITAITIVISKQNSVTNNPSDKSEIDNSWHSSTISKVYKAYDETEILLTDGTRIILSEDFYTDKSLRKLNLENGMDLHLKNKVENEELRNSKIKTYVCTSKIDTNDCFSVGTVIKSSFTPSTSS